MDLSDFSPTRSAVRGIILPLWPILYHSLLSTMNMILDYSYSTMTIILYHNRRSTHCIALLLLAISLYPIPSNVALPVYVTPQFSFSDGTGRFEIKVGPKQTMGKVVSTHFPSYIGIYTTTTITWSSVWNQFVHNWSLEHKHYLRPSSMVCKPIDS